MRVRRVRRDAPGDQPEQLMLMVEESGRDTREKAAAASQAPSSRTALDSQNAAREEKVLPPASTRVRRRLVMTLGVIWSLAVVARLGYLQIHQYEHYAEKKESTRFAELELEGPRGAIYDSRGRKLAISVPAISVWANPREIEDPQKVLAQLTRILPLSRSEIARLKESLDGNRSFTYVLRQIEPEMGEQVMALGLDGVYLQEEPKRYYPMGALAAHVLGFVGRDHEGLAGLEHLYDDVVRGVTLERTVFKRGDRGYVLDERTMKELAENGSGADLHLTLDSSLQHLAERELERMVERTSARGGSVVMLDSRDSAVLAMASWPTFDPNAVSGVNESQRNQAVAGAYEPGSTFKVVTAAAALENVVVHPDDQFDCEMGGLRIGRTFIRDHKAFGVLTFREILEKSSNVGVMKIARATGSARLLTMIQAFGMGQPTGVDLPGEAAGQLNLDHWDPRRDRTHWAYASFGQGISVTPIQLANAFATVARGGESRRPYIVRSIERDGKTIDLTERSLGGGAPTAGQVTGRPISAQTAATLTRMLEGVVENGTGKAAAIEGYRVAGKTGTAEKSSRDGVSKIHKIASFAGIAPARDPRIVALVVLDEPRGLTHGGQVGAPVFSALVGQALLYLGVPPPREEFETQVAWLTLPRHLHRATDVQEEDVATIAEHLTSLFPSRSETSIRPPAPTSRDPASARRGVGSSGGSR